MSSLVVSVLLLCGLHIPFQSTSLGKSNCQALNASAPSISLHANFSHLLETINPTKQLKSFCFTGDYTNHIENEWSLSLIKELYGTNCRFDESVSNASCNQSDHIYNYKYIFGLICNDEAVLSDYVVMPDIYSNPMYAFDNGYQLLFTPNQSSVSSGNSMRNIAIRDIYHFRKPYKQKR